MENQTNPSQSSLRVTQMVLDDSEIILTPEELEKQMSGALNEKVNTLGFEQLLKMPMISGAISQGIAMLPMGVDKAKEYFGNDEVRIMIYYDPESGAFVMEKLYTANVDMTYKKDSEAKDFFFITKEDLDNPQAFLKKMQAKIGFNLF